MFHFNKDGKTFLRLVLELLDTEPELINLRTIGADVDEAIAMGFKRVFPNIKVLCCVRYLRQRDEMKLDSHMEKVTTSAAEKVQGKVEVLNEKILKYIEKERVLLTILVWNKWLMMRIFLAN